VYGNYSAQQTPVATMGAGTSLPPSLFYDIASTYSQPVVSPYLLMFAPLATMGSQPPLPPSLFRDIASAYSQPAVSPYPLMSAPLFSADYRYPLSQGGVLPTSVLMSTVLQAAPSQTVNQTINQTINQAVNQMVNQAVNQAVNQVINQVVSNSGGAQGALINTLPGGLTQTTSTPNLAQPNQFIDTLTANALLSAWTPFW